MFDSHPTTPEQTLYSAVMLRAFLDLFSNWAPSSSETESDRARHEALRFFTDDYGDWARSRADFCAILDLDPDDMREQVIGWLEGEPLPEASRATFGNGIERARQIWAEAEEQKRIEREERIARAEEQRLARVQRRATLKERKMAEARRVAPANARLVTQAQILDAIADKSMSVREIGFALDGALSDTAIRDRLSRLEQRGRVVRNGSRWQRVDDRLQQTA